MNREIRITPAAARREINRAMLPFVNGTVRNMVQYLQDDEDEERLFIFYEPTSDYCLNVQITKNLHANEARRKLNADKKIPG